MLTRAWLCGPALLVLLLFGCAKSGPSVPDATRGKQIFANNCATCHGATGREGGTGPSLIGEHRHMNLSAAIRWIEHPEPPMPALYPDPLDEREVEDVAAYVETL
jgi:mono/diheme cytochrome c family protein